MAIHLSVLKRERQDRVRNLRNRSRRSNLRTVIKKIHASIDDNNIEQTQAALQEAISTIDRAASKNTIHRNSAARQKSRLMRKVNALTPSEE